MTTNDVGGPDAIKDRIKKWLKLKRKIDAAVWTNLKINWQEKRHHRFSVGDAVRYLEELEQHQLEATGILKRAREYVRNAPEQIQTRVRKRMGNRTDWADTELADALFESC